MSALDPLSSVTAALKRAALIPDVLPETFEPSLLFSVVYPASGCEVVLGNELTPADTADEPEIVITPMNLPAVQSGSADQRAVSYTLAMLDPDAPSRAAPAYRSFRHWVVTGLKAPMQSPGPSQTSDLRALHTKPATTPYRPPGPRPNSGLHRYTFLLFQEPGDAFAIPPGAPEHGAALEERRGWDAVAFGARYGLTLVGATFFVVRAD